MKDVNFEYVLAFGMITLLLIAFLFYLVFKYRKKIRLQKEKVRGLKHIGEQNAARQEKKSLDAENKILELTHTVRRLENNINEGTKNQVVVKIEDQQNRRARELKRTGLEEASK